MAVLVRRVLPRLPGHPVPQDPPVLPVGVVLLEQPVAVQLLHLQPLTSRPAHGVLVYLLVAQWVVRVVRVVVHLVPLVLR